MQRRNIVYEKLYGKGRSQIENKSKESYSNGDFYTGKFKHGKKHGYGVLTYSDGKRYEGFFKNGLKHGHGKVIHKNGKAIYVEYKNDQLVTKLFNDKRDWELNDWRSNNTHFQCLAPKMIKSEFNPQTARENRRKGGRNLNRRRPVTPRVMSKKERDLDNFINQQKNQDYFRTNHPSQRRSKRNYGVGSGMGTSRRYQNSYISRSIANSKDVYRSYYNGERSYY